VGRSYSLGSSSNRSRRTAGEIWRARLVNFVVYFFGPTKIYVFLKAQPSRGRQRMITTSTSQIITGRDSFAGVGGV